MSFVSGNTLQILSLNGNPIQYIDEESFFGLNTLSEIFLSQMIELSSIRVHSFSRLKNLTRLICSDNKKLDDIDEEAFSLTMPIKYVRYFLYFQSKLTESQFLFILIITNCCVTTTTSIKARFETNPECLVINNYIQNI